MDPERWNRIQTLFQEALDLPPEERDAYLAEACGDDLELLHELTSLLAAATRASRDLTRPMSPKKPASGQQFGPYRLLEMLGQGGMGAVYKALDTRLERLVAVKVLFSPLARDADMLRRFHQEARAAALLDHPNICTVYDLGEDPGGWPYIVMAYYPGETLAARLVRGPLPLAEAIDVARQVAGGLAAAHARGIVHRDIKPGNVMLSERGVKVLDFGIAKVQGLDLTRTDQRPGTLAYMAPEQYRGEQPDPRTDLWSLGVLLYEMLIGRRPFQGDHPQTLMHAVLTADPEPLSGKVPPALVRLIEGLLQKDRRLRPASAEEVLAGLDSGRRAPSPSGSGGQRRQVTLLRAQPLMPEDADPESLLPALESLRSAAEKVVSGLEGELMETGDDSLLACFGHLSAHEDDARRAVTAALALCQALSGHQARDQQQPLPAPGIGIHTGLAVLSGAGLTLAGELPRTALRLQNLAGAGEVLASPVTWQLVRGYFHGLARPDGEGWQILSASTARDRLEAEDPERLSHLVGRDQELALLWERWQRVRDEEGQYLLITGDAGIGKSRLVRALMEKVVAESGNGLTICYCSPYHRNSVLYPIVELLEREVLEFRSEDPPQRRLERLQTFLARYDLTEELPLFAGLLSLPDAPTSPLSPDQQRQRLLESLLTYLLSRAREQPLLLVVEDLHWADPTTLELLGLLTEQGEDSRLFALFTCRPDNEPVWQGAGRSARLDLSGLSRQQARKLVQSLADDGLPSNLAEVIVNRADGVPLFIEELTRAVLDEPGRAPGEIPSTLQETLNARLDRLGPIRDTLHWAAVLGREFDLEWLAAACARPADEVEQDLEALRAAELLRRRKTSIRVGWRFSHVLIQEAAYQSLLSNERRSRHRRAVRALEDAFPAICRQHPELPAYHYTAAGMAREAIDYWRAAGLQAKQRSANREAINHFEQALELAVGLDDVAQREQLELTLRMDLGPALLARHGHSAPAVVETGRRCLELADRLGDDQRLFPALWALSLYHHHRSERPQARELLQRYVDIAERLGDIDQLVAALPLLGQCHQVDGRFDLGRPLAERTLSLYDPERHRHHGATYGLDPGVLAHLDLFLDRWHYGYPEQALHHARRALELARELQHANTTSLGYLYLMWVHQLRGEREAILALGRENREFCDRYGLVTARLRGDLIYHWACDEAEPCYAILDAILEARALVGVATYFKPLVAEIELRQDRHDRARQLIEECLTLAETCGERFRPAHLHYLQGLTLWHGRLAESAVIEQAFQRSLAIAREQDSPMQELITRTAWCRFIRHNGGDDTAMRQALAEVYGHFSEGFDTEPLRAARTVLDGD